MFRADVDTGISVPIWFPGLAYSFKNFITTMAKAITSKAITPERMATATINPVFELSFTATVSLSLEATLSSGFDDWTEGHAGVNVPRSCPAVSLLPPVLESKT